MANQKKTWATNSSFVLFFACDWLIEWHEFFKPIQEQRKEKTNQSQITFNT